MEFIASGNLHPAWAADDALSADEERGDLAVRGEGRTRCPLPATLTDASSRRGGAGGKRQSRPGKGTTSNLPSSEGRSKRCDAVDGTESPQRSIHLPARVEATRNCPFLGRSKITESRKEPS